MNKTADSVQGSAFRKTKEIEKLKQAIRDVPDFPKRGIIFKDITPLLSRPELFSKLINLFARRYLAQKIDKVIAIEARGFILGAALAYRLKTGFVPIRKKNKLPWKVFSAAYTLEYGQDSLEVHQDALQSQERVLIVDDVLATGGTVSAVSELIGKLGAEVVEVACLIELTFLNGREKLGRTPVFSLIQY